MNIATLLEMAVEAHPDRIALSSTDGHLSYAELLKLARGAAGLLAGEQRPFLVYLDVSSAAAPVALFAAALAGSVYVPLNYRLSADALSQLLARVTPGRLIIPDQRAGATDLPPALAPLSPAAFLDLASQGGDVPVDQADEPIAVQLFTSGTTGQPKAAILRHENLFSYIVGSVEFASAGSDESTLICVPPYHIAGISAVLSAIYGGRRIVQLADFDPDAWLRAIETERVTHAFVVPTMLGRILDEVEAGGRDRDLSSLRAIAYGGGRMPLPVIERAMARLPHVDFTNAYGLTETSSTISLLDPAAHRSACTSSDPAIRRRLGSVGRPLPSVELAVLDGEGKPCGPEQVGRIHVRGAQVSGEYGGTGSSVDPRGWFDTKDLGFVDSDGYLFLEGRADDVIVRGGENISPGEVEEALCAHQGVADAAVVGIPDEEWGEAVAAAIVPSDAAPDMEELRTWVRSRLRSSRVPQHIRFVQALPYNDMGKLLRRVVRSEFAPAPPREDDHER